MMQGNFGIFALLLIFAACTQAAKTSNSAGNSPNPSNEQATKVVVKLDSSQIWDNKKLTKSETEWEQTLSAEAYRVLREKGTERAYTHPYNEQKTVGIYACAACKLPLFSSSAKFNSGTGWPSFFEPIHPTHVGDIVDNSHGMQRTEVVCNRCGGHLGHVFDDGPKPTGLRYCINGVSLQFTETK